MQLPTFQPAASTSILLLILRKAPAGIAAMVLIASAGCSPGNLGSGPREPSFVEQLTAVKAGHSEGIHVTLEAIADADLLSVAGATRLRVLIIDSDTGSVSASGLQRLTDLPKLEHLRIRGRGVDDAALGEIAKIKSLRILNVPKATFTDSGLSTLQELPHLVQLRFGSPEVTDAGMKTLAGLPALLRLHLIDVPITDAGLKTLAGMDQLESLYIDGGDFSDAALEELFRQRPQLHVHLNQEHHDRDPHRHQH